MLFLQSKWQYARTHFIEIRRWVESFLILWIFMIKYGQTDTLPSDRIIVATAGRFGAEACYSMYIDSFVLYLLPVLACIYIVLKYIRKYTILDAKWKKVAFVIAAAMAFWRVVSNSYYYTISAALFIAGGFFTVLLFVSYFIVFRYMICILLFLFETDAEVLFENCSHKKIFWSVWVLYLICWLPRLVLNYPMAFDWDTGIMFDTVLNGIAHEYPIVQVNILKALYRLGCAIGSVEGVFFGYMCIKYLCTTFLFTSILFYFQQKKSSRKLWVAVLVITLFCPIFQSWCIYIAKDSNYTFCFTGLILMVCLFILDQEFIKKHKILYGIVTAFFACGVYCLRGNGIYVDIAFIVFGIISYINIEKIKSKLLTIKWRRPALMIIAVMIAGGIILQTVGTFSASHEMSRETGEGISDLWQQGQKYLKFYIWRVTYFFRTESISRYSVIIQTDCPDEVRVILGEDLGAVREIEYTAGNGTISPSLTIDTDKQDLLTQYILRHEPVLFMESIIAKVYGYFDIFRHHTGTYGSGIEYGTYNMYELNKYWENRPEWQIRSSFLQSSYERFRKIPILGCTCDTGLYVWLLIVVSIYLLMTRGRKVLCMLAPCWLTCAGTMISGYNAYMRFCLPFVLSMPIFLLLCSVRGREN